MWCHPASACCSSVLKPYHYTIADSHNNLNNVSSTDTLRTVSFCFKTQMATTTTATPKTMEESDVGILYYISPLPGFRGILKQRYADFMVNEVDLDGNVVHLTCLDAPPEVVKEEAMTEVAGEISEGKSYAHEIELFRSVAGDSDTELLEAFISQASSAGGDSASPIVLSPDSDKAHRTAMHNFFKSNFKFLVTDTVDGPDASSKCIRVRLNSGGNSNGGRNSRKRKERSDKPFDSRGTNNWPEHLGKFLRFHLYKENKDTQEALGIIGKMLGVQPRSFGFAGTKDKRSVSTQRVTVFKQQASRLAALNDRLIGIKVGDFCHIKEELLLGHLLGNRFTITLRGVVADSEDTIKSSAESLGRHGFINYFGLQRFGSGSVPTHLVGAALFRGEWEGAVDLILDPRAGEKDVIRKAREYYKETGDIDGTLRQLPRHLVAEKAILQCLKKCPGNYLQALKAIPRTLRMMYAHSYQSYLWNHAASLRVQKYGTDQVVVGDLVYCNGDYSAKETVGVSEQEDGNCDDTDDCSHLDETSGTDLPVKKSNPVKVLTEEDISTGNYTIEDVILPMPGSRVIFPMNDIAEVYHDLAKKDNIDLTQSTHGVKEFSIIGMTGSYRRVFQKPADFEWELLSYTDGNKPLTETDMDKIFKTKLVNMVIEMDQTVGNGKNLAHCAKQLANGQNDSKVTSDHSEIEGQQEVRPAEVESLCVSNLQGGQIALKLSFTLPSSSYATMAIRELLKTSTSVAFHKTLN